MWSFSFNYVNSLSSSYDNITTYPDKNNRFIQFACKPYTIQNNPNYENTNLTCNPITSIDTNTFPSLSIKSGKKYMVWDSAWAYSIWPNKSVADIICKRFTDKYKTAITIKTFQFEKEYHIFAILTDIIPVAVSFITNYDKISEDFKTIDDLYIGGFLIQNDEISQVCSYGNIDHHILLPKELINLKTNHKLQFTEKSINKHQELNFNQCKQYIEKIEKNENNEQVVVLTKLQSQMILDIVNDVIIPVENAQDLQQMFYIFTSMLQQGQQITIKDNNENTYSLTDIMDKITLLLEQYAKNK